jgi:ribosome-binding factor A
MANNRAARVADQMREELAQLIRDEVKDPRIGFCSIVKVEVSNDLRHAKVFVSVLGNEQQKKDTLKGLTSATGFLRSELGRRIQLRYTPEIHFVLDESIEHGARIAQLLAEVEKERGK